MTKYTATVLLIAATALLGLGQSVQQTTADRARVIGEITAVDASAGHVTIKNDSGNVVSILINGETTVLSVPPGEPSLEKAQRISIGDLGQGDRVYARYAPGADSQVVPARQLVVMSAARIKMRQSEEKEAWQKRSISGVVASINPKAGEITVVSPQRDGIKQIIVSASKVRRFRRYSPDSIRFSDARPSSFAELRPGDQLRALGEKNADGTALAAEEIISGGFRTIGGTVTSVSSDTGELKIKLFGNNQPLTLVAGKNSVIRRIPAKVATLIAQRAVSTNAKKSETEDSQEIIERLPTIPVSELKAGDVILTASAMGNDPTRPKAVNVLAGIDGVINALQRAGAMNSGRPLSTGLPPGVLDVTAGQQ
jgi:Cu/Ag efflux protein CusF